jgi:hypothetical protein
MNKTGQSCWRRHGDRPGGANERLASWYGIVDCAGAARGGLEAKVGEIEWYLATRLDFCFSSFFRRS